MTRKEINASDNGQVMKKRLKAGIERLARKAMYRRNSVPEVESEIWIDQALDAHRDRPLQAILTDNYDGDEMEGYVVRVAHEYPYSEFRDHVGKYVRAGHVQNSHGHWIREIMVKNELKK